MRHELATSTDMKQDAQHNRKESKFYDDRIDFVSVIMNSYSHAVELRPQKGKHECSGFSLKQRFGI